MKKKNGFTLIELLLTLALISVIIVIGTNLLIFGTKSHAITLDEFSTQSNIRLVSQKMNKVIRDASAVYVLHREDDTKLTEEWNYIMVSSDKSKLLEYIWNGATKKHDIKELVSGNSYTQLGLEFNKKPPADEDKLLEFDLKISSNGKHRTILTELEAKNALQIIDRSYDKDGNVIAYRYDTRIDEASNAQAVLSMVLDRSGSMDDAMNGTSTWTTTNKRIYKMRTEAVRLLDELSKKPNINVSIVPFSSTANNPSAMLNLTKNLTAIKKTVTDLTASGGTNTGDGIRRGYYQIKQFNEIEANKNKTNKNFMIILVDGVTTFASVNKVVNEVISSPKDQGDIYVYNGYKYLRNSTQSYKTKVYFDDGVDVDLEDFYNDGSNDYSYSKVNALKKSYESSKDEKEKKGDAYKGENFKDDKGITYYLKDHKKNNKRWTYFYEATEYEYIRYAYIFNGIKKGDYVIGDNNIDNSKSNNNEYYTNGRYAGNGGNLDPWGTAYVDLVGEMVKVYKEGTNETIKTYIIGFSSKAEDYGSLSDIAIATTGEATFYTAGDSEALEEIFRAIQKEISDALWHIGGPN